MASKGIESSMYQVTQHIVNSTGVRTPRTPLFAIPAVIHWHGLTGTQPIKRTAAIIKYFFCVGHFVNSNFSFMFAVREHLKLLQDAKNISFKVKTKIWGRRTVASTEDLSEHRFECSRSDRPSLFNNQNLFIMREQKGQSTTCADEIGTHVPEIKNLYAGSRQSVINGLYNRPISQLVHDFMVEMDAKNKAYYFILENGHFDAFREYCLGERRAV
jgi:hypothetical protein